MHLSYLGPAVSFPRQQALLLKGSAWQYASTAQKMLILFLLFMVKSTWFMTQLISCWAGSQVSLSKISRLVA